MNLNIHRAVICTAAPAGDLIQEQGIELDHVLPDYYPDVCKLVKCIITPTIVSESISGDRLSYELRADVRILYCGEDSHILQCVTQTLHFSRTAELGTAEDVTAEILPVTDYANCRAVSRRRLDVRGAVTIRIRTSAQKQQEAVTSLSGRAMQTRSVPVQYPAKQMHAVRHLFLSEELDLGASSPSVLHIVRCEAHPTDESHQFVSGKLLVQGNLHIHLLYACEKDGGGSLEPMSFSIPYSQLAELEGLEEQDFCDVHTMVAACDLKPVTDAGGEVRLLRCEAELRIACTAVRMASEMLVCDAYSTEHPTSCTTAALCTEESPEHIAECSPCTAALSCPDDVPECVHDAWCDVRNLTAKMDSKEGGISISGTLCWNALIREKGGMPRLLEKETAFFHLIPIADADDGDTVQIRAAAENCSYTLSEQSEVQMKAEIRLSGMFCRSRIHEVVTDIAVQEEVAHRHDYALKLYFGRAGEAIWDIAKRCRTSTAAIMEENDLTEEVLSRNGMLLIPIVNC